MAIPLPSDRSEWSRIATLHLEPIPVWKYIPAADLPDDARMFLGVDQGGRPLFLRDGEFAWDGGIEGQWPITILRDDVKKNRLPAHYGDTACWPNDPLPWSQGHELADLKAHIARQDAAIARLQAEVDVLAQK